VFSGAVPLAAAPYTFNAPGAGVSFQFFGKEPVSISSIPISYGISALKQTDRIF